MSEHASSPASDQASFMDRHYFLLRRLHSLSGIVPVGLFVCVHLFTNFQLAIGDFQHEVEWIHSLPALMFLEITLWLSIAFHAALGLYYTFSGKPNVKHYPYMDNWRYVMQRWTGIIALLFIFFHVATLRWRWDIFGWYTPFYVMDETGHPLATPTTAMALQNPVVALLYAVGSLSIIFHWCNGLWTAAISWGLTVTVPAQRRWGYICTALGVGLTVFMFGAIAGARLYQITPEDEAAFERQDRAQRGIQTEREQTAVGQALVVPTDEAPAGGSFNPQAIPSH